MPGAGAGAKIRDKVGAGQLCNTEINYRYSFLLLNCCTYSKNNLCDEFSFDLFVPITFTSES